MSYFFATKELVYKTYCFLKIVLKHQHAMSFYILVGGKHLLPF